MKSLVLACLSCLWCLCAGVAAAQAGPSPTAEEDHLRDQAAQALRWADFEALERMHAQFQQPGQRTAAGRSKLHLFRAGLERTLNGPSGATDAYFVQMELLTLQWARAHPDSALAHVLHAKALSAHAWSYRGSGYHHTVPPEAWRDFERYIARAVEYLATHKDVVLRSSSGYVEMLLLGRASGWRHDALWALAQAGLALNLDDESLYQAMVTSSLPKWGGSPVLLDKVINDIARLTAPLHGDIFYSRPYGWAAEQEFQHQLFNRSGASWPRMKAGLQELMARHPGPLAINSMAYFACLARDKPVLLDMLEHIASRPVLSLWGQNASRSFETCQRWASEQ